MRPTPDTVPRRPNVLLEAIAHETVRVANAGRPRFVPPRLSDDVALVRRAAVEPELMSDADWGVLAAGNAVADYFATLGPSSAGATLLGAGLRVDLAGRASVVMPSIVAAAGAAKFVSEASPLPVIAAGPIGATLSEHKLGGLAILSRETASRLPTALPLVRQLLAESVALGLDAVLFSSDAASAAAPAGLLSTTAVSVIPSAGSGLAGIAADLASLADALEPLTGGVAFVASPGLALLANSLLPGARVLSSSALADGTIIGVALAALVSTVGSRPVIDVSNEVAIHMDTVPLELVAAGAPATTSDPIRSAWQSDVIVIRVLLDIGWTVRGPGSVAVMTGVSW